MPLPDVPQDEYDTYTASLFAQRTNDRINSLNDSQSFLRSSGARIASLGIEPVEVASASSPLLQSQVAPPIFTPPQLPPIPQPQLPQLPQIGVPGPGQQPVPQPAPAPQPGPTPGVQPLPGIAAVPSQPAAAVQAPLPSSQRPAGAPMPVMPLVPGPAPAPPPERPTYAPAPTTLAPAPTSPFGEPANGPFAPSTPATRVTAISSAGDQGNIPASINVPINAGPTITRQQTEAALVGTPLEGLGGDIWDLGVRYNVDPAFALSVAKNESAYGATPMQARNNNVWDIANAYYGGVPVEGSRWGQYPDKRTAAEAFYKLITQEYYPRGQTSVGSVMWGPNGNQQHAYAPLSENSSEYPDRLIATMRTYGSVPPATGASPAAQPAQTTTAARPTAMAQSQFGDAELTTAEAYASCGPAAAVRFAQAYGRNPTLREAVDLARSVGWTAEQGMAGITSEQALLGKMGIDTRIVSGRNWDQFAKEAQTGNPVTISTPGHYYYADGFNPDNGTFHVGRSGLDLKGGSEWMTPGQMERLMGPAQGALFANNPTVPASSVVVADQPKSLDETRRQISASFGATTPTPPAQRPPIEPSSDPQVRRVDQAVEMAYIPETARHQAPEPSRATAAPALPAGGKPSSGVTASNNPLDNLGSLIGNAIQGALQTAVGGFGGPPGGPDRGIRDETADEQPQPAEAQPAQPAQDVGTRARQMIEQLQTLPGGGKLGDVVGVPDLLPPDTRNMSIWDAIQEAMQRGNQLANLPRPTLGPGGLGMFDPRLGNDPRLEIPDLLEPISQLTRLFERGGVPERVVGALDNAFEREASGQGRALAGGVSQSMLDAVRQSGEILPANIGSPLQQITRDGQQSAASGLSRTRGEQAWDSLVRNLTDSGTDLNTIEAELARRLRRPLTDSEKVGLLARVDPTHQASATVEQALGPSLQAIPNKALPDFYKLVEARTNQSVAEGLAKQAEQQFVEGGVAPGTQQALNRAQNQLDILQDAQSRGASGLEPLIAEAQRGVDAARADIEQATRDVPEAARAQGYAQLTGRTFSGPGGVPISYDDVVRQQADLQARYANQPRTWQAMQDGLQAIQDFRKQLLQERVDHGLIDQQTADDLLRTYDFWTPTNMLEYMADERPGVGAARGSRFNVSNPGFRSYTPEGSSAEHENHVAALIREAYSHKRRIAQNDVSAALIRGFADDSTVLRKIADNLQEYRASQGRMHPPEYRLKAGEQKITALLDGKRQEYVTDNALMKAAIEQAAQGGDASMLSKLATAPATLVRETAVQRNPGFLPVNLARDTVAYALRNMAEGGVRGNVPSLALNLGPAALTAAATSNDDPNRGQKIAAALALGTGTRIGLGKGLGLGPSATREFLGAFADAMEGLGSGRMTGAGVRQLELAGGGMRGGGFFGGGIRGAGPRAAEEELRRLTRRNVLTVRNGADLRQLLGDAAAFGWVKALGNRLEQAPRLATMRMALQRGATPLEAMIQARNVTTDFNRGGRFTRELNRYIPFLNVGVQAPAQLKRLIQDNPTGAFFAGLTLLGAPAAASEAWNYSDPQRAKDYEDTPQYLKRIGVVLMLPGEQPRDANGNRVPQKLFLPIPNEFMPFVEAGREGFARISGQGRPRSAGELVGTAGAELTPLQASSPEGAIFGQIPPPLGTVAQLGLNRDVFRGTTIANQYSDDNASNLGKGLAPILTAAVNQLPGHGADRVRPSHVDFALRDIFSGTGQQALNALDALSQREPRVPGTATETPLVGSLAGRFVRGTGGQAWQDVTQPGQMMAQDIREKLRSLGGETQYYEPSEVPDAIQKIPLRREEQVEYQRLTNQYFDQYLRRLMQQPRFETNDAARKALVDAAMQSAREKAGAEVIKQVRSSGSSLLERYRQKSAAY